MCKNAGIVIKYVPIKGHEKEIFELIKKNHLKYYGTHVKMSVDFLRKLHENMKDKLRAIITGKDGVPFFVGIIFIENNSNIRLFKAGTDELAASGSFVTFNAFYYVPLKYAIYHHYEFLDTGTGSYRTMLLRGAKAKEKFVFLRATSRFRNLMMRFILYLFGRRKKARHIKQLIK